MDATKRPAENESGGSTKRSKAEDEVTTGEEVRSPFLLDPISAKITKHIFVPAGDIGYTQEMEDAVVDFNDLLEDTETPSEVPPVPSKYGTAVEDRHMAEFHYAIWLTDRNSWHLFPSYQQYLRARKDGRFVAEEQ